MRRGRGLLRRELMRRLTPLGALDAAVFLRINHLPHPEWLDPSFYWLSLLMTGGHARVVLILLLWFRDPRRAFRKLLQVAPGDVLSGSLAGTLLARFYQTSIKAFFPTRRNKRTRPLSGQVSNRRKYRCKATRSGFSRRSMRLL
jgi:hypothetical protein